MANETKNIERLASDRNLRKNNDDVPTRNNIIKENLDEITADRENDLENVKKLKDDNIKTNLFQKTKRILSYITVEPILLCYVMPSVLSSLATQNLYLEKACRVNLQFETHVCDALTQRETTNFTSEEEAVQKLVASVQGWKTVLQSLLPCILLIFLGAYSDKIGRRKFCMLLPLVGEFLTSIGLIVNTFYFYQLPVEVAGVTEAIFPALTGGWCTMFMGVFSYMADITTEEERTFRIGIANFFYSLGIPVGSALSGILVKMIGLYGVFSISAGFYITGFVYCFFRIKEVKKHDSNVVSSKNCCDFLRKFFDIRYVRDTAKMVFKRGANKRRARVILLLVILCLLIGPVYGEIAVTYLYARYRFNWNEVDYSIFSTFSVITSLLGTLFTVAIFSYVFKFDDAFLGLIACTSKILAAFMYAFAIKTWQFYLGSLIEMFNGASYIAIRSMISKLALSNELGKVMSLFGVAEAMMPLIYTPMYTTVYAASLTFFPGAFYLLGATLLSPAVVIFTWMYIYSRRIVNSEHKKDDDAENRKVDTKLNSVIDDEAFELEKTEKVVNGISETAAKRYNNKLSIIPEKNVHNNEHDL